MSNHDESPDPADATLTNEERREAARRKLEERLAHEHKQQQRRRIIWASGVGVVIVALLAVGGYYGYSAWDDSRHTECEYFEAETLTDKLDAANEQGVPPDSTPEEIEARQRQLDDLTPKAEADRPEPQPETRVRNSGEVMLTFNTDQGEIPVVLNRADAACNVAAMVWLAERGFYNDTICPRLTTRTSDDIAEGIEVMQCGDPTGTTLSGPGWSSPGEFTKAQSFATPPDLQPNPLTGAYPVIFPRGTVAIANNGEPDSGSSQFFIVINDSALAPEYTVVGAVDEAGLATLDRIKEGGLVAREGAEPAPDQPLVDGAPADGVTIETAVVDD